MKKQSRRRMKNIMRMIEKKGKTTSIYGTFSGQSSPSEKVDEQRPNINNDVKTK